LRGFGADHLRRWSNTTYGVPSVRFAHATTRSDAGGWPGILHTTTVPALALAGHDAARCTTSGVPE
jgi:hypothetical protein